MISQMSPQLAPPSLGNQSSNGSINLGSLKISIPSSQFLTLPGANLPGDPNRRTSSPPMIRYETRRKSLPSLVFHGLHRQNSCSSRRSSYTVVRRTSENNLVSRCTRIVSVFVASCSNVPLRLSVPVTGVCTVSALIGRVCEQHRSLGLLPKLKHKYSHYCLRAADTYGEIDYDLPELDKEQLVGHVGLNSFALESRVIIISDASEWRSNDSENSKKKKKSRIKSLKDFWSRITKRLPCFSCFGRTEVS
eukprot:170381_1